MQEYNATEQVLNDTSYTIVRIVLCYVYIYSVASPMTIASIL